jgi:hypothetical protein
MKLAAVAAVLLAGTATAAVDLRTAVPRPAQVGKGYQLIARTAAFTHRPIDTGLSGVGPLRFTITMLRDAKLARGYVAVRVRAVGKLASGKRVDQTSYAVYQRVGDVLSGIYTFGPNTTAQQRFAFHAAEASTRLLRKLRAAPKGPPA